MENFENEKWEYIKWIIYSIKILKSKHFQTDAINKIDWIIGSFTRQNRPAFLVDVNNEYEHIVHILHILKNHRRQYYHSNSHNRHPFWCSLLNGKLSVIYKRNDFHKFCVHLLFTLKFTLKPNCIGMCVLFDRIHWQMTFETSNQVVERTTPWTQCWRACVCV